MKPLFENIFCHFWPRQFKAQIPTGLDHNKWSFYRWLSRGCLVVVGTFFRYIGLSANRHKKLLLCQVTSSSSKMKWGGPWDVDGLIFWIEIVNCHVHCAMPVLLRITSLRRQATPMRQSSIPMLLFDRFRSSQKTSLLQDECRHLECPRLWRIMMIS